MSLRVIQGNADVIRQLEDALVEAKEGRLVGVVICGITDGGCGWSGAVRDDVDYPWPRLLAAVSTAHMQLVADGTEHWT